MSGEEVKEKRGDTEKKGSALDEGVREKRKGEEQKSRKAEKPNEERDK